MKKLIVCVLLFIFSFMFYLYTAPPGSIAYRDAGEMVSVAQTVGIAHPPGYPLYALLGKLASLFPLSNIAYRVNLISVISGALSVTLCFLCLTHLIDLCPALVTALFLCSAYLHWYLSIVPEMYSLNALFALLLIYVCILHLTLSTFHQSLYLFSFIFGLGLGNRLDLVLILPGFLYLFWKKGKNEFSSRSSLFPLRSVLFALCFFFLGFSIYLYLPIRSASGPLLDWNHPATFERLWSTLSRKTHGGTLDLLSKGYRTGENFLPSILFYLQHLAKEFLYLGIPLGLVGLIFLFRKNRALAIATLTSYLLSGACFIYMSNLPPNPHALAILEAHFLLPNIFFVLWIGFGIQWLCKHRTWLTYLLLPLTLMNFIFHFPLVNKRNNFFVEDYARNVLSSIKPKGIVILREDVQLFSLWYRQLVRKKRPDAIVIAQGLAQSPWYQEQIKRWYPGEKVILSNLKEAESVSNFFRGNRRTIYFSGDCELPDENFLSTSSLKFIPEGLVLQLAPLEKISKTGSLTGLASTDELLSSYENLTHFYFYRGRYNYQAHYEFFAPDLIEEYAKAYQRIGFAYLKKGDYSSAEKYLLYALSCQPAFPQAYSLLGYLYFTGNRWTEAEKFYLYAVDAHLDLLNKAKEYRSLPGIEESIKMDIANNYNNLGVVYERLGKEDLAVSIYEKVLEYNPQHIDAQYNLAVVYWKKGDWEKVISYLEQVLMINPQHQQAKNYLLIAKQKLHQK